MQDIPTVIRMVTARDGLITPGHLPTRADSGILLTGSIPSIPLSVQACSSLTPLILELHGVGTPAGVQDGAAGMIPGILSTDRMHTAAGAGIPIMDITVSILRGDTILTTRPGAMTITAGTAASVTLITDTKLYM